MDYLQVAHDQTLISLDRQTRSSSESCAPWDFEPGNLRNKSPYGPAASCGLNECGQVR